MKIWKRLSCYWFGHYYIGLCGSKYKRCIHCGKKKAKRKDGMR